MSHLLQFSSGDSVVVAGNGLIGRRPSAEPGEYVDRLIPLFDPGHAMSKTHLEFGDDDGEFWVSDRFSANGTTIVAPDGAIRRCDPGKRYRLARGSKVELGDQFFIVS